MPPFPHLADAATYEPNTFDYSPPAGADPALFPSRAQWIDAFRRTTADFEKRAAGDASVADAPAAAARFAARWLSALAGLEDPAQPLNCLILCALRDRLLREEGFADCFRAVKAEDNDKALALLPALLAELDALPHADRLQAVVEGVFAGNIFDLGASSTAAMHASGSLCYHDTRAKLQKRPWSVDDFDALAARIAAGPAHAKAVLFVDNSGADVVLGMLPLARELVRRGAAVILAANTVPSINDVTAAELSALLPRVAAVDPAVAGAVETGRLRVVASGSDLPVIDLRGLSDELVAEVADADLVVLEGMGRAIESNLRAAFTIDVLCLGMVKHVEVAAALGATPLFGCVCRFTPAPAR